MSRTDAASFSSLLQCVVAVHVVISLVTHLSLGGQLGNYNARVLVTGLERRLKLGQLILLRIVVPITIYFVSALELNLFILS